MYRYPKGKVCCFCRNTYNHGGYEHEYNAGVIEYGNQCQVAGTKELQGHASFLQTRNKDIADQQKAERDDPDSSLRVRIGHDQLEEARQEAKVTLMMVQKEAGYKDKKPEERFIEEKYWDEEKYGPKPEEPAKEWPVSGTTLKGWWIKPEQPGVHVRQYFHQNTVKEQRRHEENEGQLGEQRLERARKQAAASFKEIHENTTKAGVTATIGIAPDMLKFAQGSISSPQVKSPLAPPAFQPDPEPNAGDSDDKEDDDDCRPPDLSAFFIMDLYRRQSPITRSRRLPPTRWRVCRRPPDKGGKALVTKRRAERSCQKQAFLPRRKTYVPLMTLCRPHLNVFRRVTSCL